jgi:hypothetical protein
MNLDELKTAWKEYERRLQSTQAMNEKIIASMIAERSGSRFSKVKKQYMLGFAWMIICLGFGVIVIVTNPFDYVYDFQYIPVIIFCIGLAILMWGMIRAFLQLKDVAVTHMNVDASLKKIIAVYEQPRRFFIYVIILFLFSQVVLFPLSFLPRNIGQSGLWPALGERLIPITISALLLFAAYRLGAFKDRDGDKFREDLNELQMLKSMASELRSDG